jgi:hypothetical protein
VTNALHGLTAALRRLPDSFADEAAELFTDIAERNGGRVMGYQLTADEKRRYVHAGGVTLIMVGTPAGFWTWRETGAKAHRIAPKRRRRVKGRRKRRGGLQPRLGGGVGVQYGPVRHPGFAGRRLWTRTVEQATSAMAQAAQQALDRAVP